MRLNVHGFTSYALNLTWVCQREIQDTKLSIRQLINYARMMVVNLNGIITSTATETTDDISAADIKPLLHSCISDCLISNSDLTLHHGPHYERLSPPLSPLLLFPFHLQAANPKSPLLQHQAIKPHSAIQQHATDKRERQAEVISEQTRESQQKPR